MKWNHTKLGNWFWRNYWYRVDWWKADRKFIKWIEYARLHTMHLTITGKYLTEMEHDYKGREKLSYLIKQFLKKQ